jgi:hypothetical protein
MCSLFFSNSKSKFIELIDLNQSRGKFSYSYSGIKNKKFQLIKKDFGMFDKSLVIEDLDLYVGHCQAPTNGLERNIFRIHPAQINNQFLYHNGILKPEFLKESSIDYQGWDTFYLNYLLLQGFFELDRVDGSFACFLIKNDIFYFFRNSLCPLYILDKDSIISGSSVKFQELSLIESGWIYEINIQEYKINKYEQFTDNQKVYHI